MSDRPAHPRCMTPDEDAAWWEADVLIRGERFQSDSPCRDCTRAFAEAMRSGGLCDGRHPGEFRPEPELVKIGHRWRHPTEDARIEARRANWREQNRQRKLRRAA